MVICIFFHFETILKKNILKITRFCLLAGLFLWTYNFIPFAYVLLMLSLITDYFNQFQRGKFSFLKGLEYFH